MCYQVIERSKSCKKKKKIEFKLRTYVVFVIYF